MPFLELSGNAHTLALNEAATAAGGFSNSTYLDFFLMGGLMPTFEEFVSASPMTNTSGAGSPYQSQILARFNSGPFTRSVAGAYPGIGRLTQTTTHKSTFIAEGTVTWWMLAFTTNVYGPESQRRQMAGDITDLGGGGSMELGDREVVDGKEFTLNDLSFILPRRIEWPEAGA